MKFTKCEPWELGCLVTGLIYAVLWYGGIGLTIMKIIVIIKQRKNRLSLLEKEENEDVHIKSTFVGVVKKYLLLFGHFFS